jgi:hypothetical protein
VVSIDVVDAVTRLCRAVHTPITEEQRRQTPITEEQRRQTPITEEQWRQYLPTYPFRAVGRDA